MATSFPASLDTYTRPQTTDQMNSPSHAGEHDNAYDAIEALEARAGVTDSAVMASVDFIAKNGPRGYLINGKIVPSVASNNLTVAIKGVDGNDPSTANPVYCRIGDTVRKISAALSVTKNAGTNWCNSGSATLATNEVDYFVYLGYNATDGVVIGFARFPHAENYDDFSTTSTNDRYCAISTITNAAAGDFYENIGRFAATLSAGAGYTWTVPTYTANNLIQRPCTYSRWLVWTPAYSASGSMTVASTSTTIAQYQVRSHCVQMQLRATMTTGGTTSNEIYATTPWDAGSSYPTYQGNVVDQDFYSGVCYRQGDHQFCVRRYDAANWQLAASRRIDFNVLMDIN